MHAVEAEDNQIPCPFCRTPASVSDGEIVEELKKRAESDDAQAIYNIGCCYRDGELGLPRSNKKAIKLWLRAASLGHAAAYDNLGVLHDNGEGVERDTKKAKHYYELAAMGGDAHARHNLGCSENDAGNMNRAVRHWMIAAAAGHDDSLGKIRECFLRGYATKDDYEKALRAHKEAKDEMKSDQRAAAAKIEYRLSSLGQG